MLILAETDLKSRLIKIWGNFRNLSGLLEKFGHGLRMPYSKKMDSKLFELRIKGKEEIRIFYTIKNNRGILLHLFKKKTQKTPPKEILTAKKKLDSI